MYHPESVHINEYGYWELPSRIYRSSDGSQRAQYNWAGAGEIVKALGNFNISDAGHRLKELIFNISPNGDQKYDFNWNTQGMVDAAASGLHPDN
jgi:hypothetical protein